MNITDIEFKEAKKLAYSWQKKVENKIDKDERDFHEMMKKLLKNPENKKSYFYRIITVSNQF